MLQNQVIVDLGFDSAAFVGIMPLQSGERRKACIRLIFRQFSEVWEMFRRVRRSGRVAEGVPLLRVYMGNCIEGSNPSFSAIF